MINKVENIIKEKINTILDSHGGSVELVNLNGDNLEIMFKGACATCPAASNTLENIVKKVIKEELPEIKSITINQGVSDDLINFAKKILKK